MAIPLGNARDTLLYLAAEDAFTSEGGHLAPEDEAVDPGVGSIRLAYQPYRDFKRMLKRHATGVSGVMATLRPGSSGRAARPATPPPH